jgi:hypothetical protein
MNKRKSALAFLALWFVGTCLASGQAANPLAKASEGDWAQYLFNSQNETVPLLSVKDQKQWRVVSVVQATSVRLDLYMMVGDSRTNALGSIAYFNKPFEPVADLAQGAKIDVVSTMPENVTVNGKAYACTKIVRKVSRAADLSKGQSGWNGTSIVWLCPDIPAGGIVKIENRYDAQLTDDSEPNKIVETLILADFGFKNWKE